METNNGSENESEWLLKADAVSLLGTSARQLERRVEAGNIKRRVEEKQPWQKAAPVYFLKADILALKAGRPNQHATLVNGNGNGNSNGHPPASYDAATSTTQLATSPPTTTTNGHNSHNSAGSELATTHATTASTLATLAAFPTQETALGLLGAFKDLTTQVSALVEATRATTPPTSKPWMSIPQAAKWSGMPPRWIRAKAEAGWDGAINVGTGKLKFWRINRDALAGLMR